LKFRKAFQKKKDFQHVNDKYDVLASLVEIEEINVASANFSKDITPQKEQQIALEL
jgi:SNF2 family protein